MKKCLALLSLLSVLLLCAACGSSEKPVDEPPAGDQPQTEGTDPQGEFDPYSEEFSVLIDGQRLGLGQQEGAFPWGTALKKESAEYESSDGFDSFEIVCADGTSLGGLRTEGAEDETDGFLTEIETENPNVQTHRGAFVGMRLEEVLELYPEAKLCDTTDLDECIYEFSRDESDGLSSIYFEFEDDTLVSLDIENLIC